MTFWGFVLHVCDVFNL